MSPRRVECQTSTEHATLLNPRRMTLVLQSPLLAQDSVAVEAQIALFFQQLLSPSGIAAAVVGAAILRRIDIERGIRRAQAAS